MRIANGQKVTDHDRKEVEKFAAFLRSVAAGKTQTVAYAETHGTVAFAAKESL